MSADRSLTRGSLERFCGKSPTDQAQIRRWRADAWHQQETPVLPLDEIKSAIDRQVVINIAERLYGKRIITGPRTQKDVTHGSR